MFIYCKCNTINLQYNGTKTDRLDHLTVYKVPINVFNHYYLKALIK